MEKILNLKSTKKTTDSKPKQAGPLAEATGSAMSRPLIDFSTLSDDAHVRLNQFLPGIIPVSKATVWRGVADKSFPAPKKLSRNCTAWRVGDLRSWLASRPAA